jgi:chemotaxis protein methyltransferase CheR
METMAITAEEDDGQMQTQCEPCDDATVKPLLSAPLSEKDFIRLKHFIYEECGIKITAAKRTMIEARLQKRLRALGLATFSRYCDYLFSPQGMADELVHMIDVITTNKTDFFREPIHFSYLTDKALQAILTRSGTKRTVTVWSAGCSSGEEAYTLAIVLQEFADYHDLDFTILASDISTRMLEKARLAIYDEERVAPIPAALRKKYLLRSKDREKGIYRIVPELRERVKFRRVNFMEGDLWFKEPIDVIFCRNVIIYFDKPTQEKLLNKLCRCLSVNGYLFLGHSETLLGMNLPLVQVAPTVYRKAG